MNDITALMATMKAAAEKATPGEWSVQFGDEVYATDGVENEQVAIATNDARDADFIALANPANVLALVEALEKAQRWERRWHQVATRVHEQACDSDVKIEELEQLLSDGVTEEALVLRERIAELESRTVTVKLPSLKQTESCERYVWSDGVFNYRSDVIGILRAAGIQVIEGEGQ